MKWRGGRWWRWGPSSSRIISNTEIQYVWLKAIIWSIIDATERKRGGCGSNRITVYFNDRKMGLGYFGSTYVWGCVVVGASCWFIFVMVCVFVRERERHREGEGERTRKKKQKEIEGPERYLTRMLSPWQEWYEPPSSTRQGGRRNASLLLSSSHSQKHSTQISEIINT